MNNQPSDIHNWAIDSQGSVFAPAEGPGRTKYAFIDVNGDVYSDDENIGFVDVDGSVYDPTTTLLGWVNADGQIYDAGNIPIGNVTKVGDVYNIRGENRGWVDPTIHFKRHPPSIRPMYMRAAAAALILIFRN
jgi:hypothetical protein